ncbi:LysR family transcriptional regulator [Candidatus Sodalis endolongispinus]|uniref:LysR family transcriptional regulator n=1 Tax=Candidatus Sodalis endolongispinus TaxID=2812662 RepID=UPI001FEBD173|nr:LysR family transcriptional regulator [Candidatus Sodalis endolongispinus]
MLRELHTFIAVTRYGTFSAAGQRIGLTQSAVGAQIRTLEQHLGMLLFDRSGRAAVLNANGQRVLPIAQEIVMLFGRMRQPATISEYRGTVRIGAISTTQTGLLCPRCCSVCGVRRRILKRKSCPACRSICLIKSRRAILIWRW